MKGIKILAIIGLIVAVGALGFAIYSHVANKKSLANGAGAKLKYSEADLEDLV